MSYYDDNGTLMRDDGRFLCQACLECKPLSELSQKDARYCTFCQPIIEYEYSLLSTGSHSKRYKPMPLKPKSIPIEAPPIYKSTGEEKTKKSTLEEKPVTVDNFRPRGRPKHYKKRELPEELIKQLNSQGMGSKAIATRVRAQYGIKVSYKTIQRILSGERKSRPFIAKSDLMD